MSTNRENLHKLLGDLREIKPLKISQLIEDVTVYIRDAEITHDHRTMQFGKDLQIRRRTFTEPTIIVDYGDGVKLTLIPDQSLKVPE